MGGCVSTADRAGKARSDEIDRQIEEDNRRFKRECKILLLGESSFRFFESIWSLLVFFRWVSTFVSMLDARFFVLFSSFLPLPSAFLSWSVKDGPRPRRTLSTSPPFFVGLRPPFLFPYLLYASTFDPRLLRFVIYDTHTVIAGVHLPGGLPLLSCICLPSSGLETIAPPSCFRFLSPRPSLASPPTLLLRYRRCLRRPRRPRSRRSSHLYKPVWCHRHRHCLSLLSFFSSA